MKVTILFDFKDGPYGGGNQFLQALRSWLKSRGEWSEVTDADVVLFNSFHAARRVLYYRFIYPQKIFIHRIDGPTRLYNFGDDPRDRLTEKLMSLCADGVVFQSLWSKTKNEELGLRISRPCKVITNAPNSSIFFPKIRKIPPLSRPVEIVITSWSSNINKGFDTYSWLDRNLDFKRYRVTFIGNSKVSFQNIRIVNPLASEELGEYLRSADIYLTASINDPCSNALIEALHCGLPALARASGGHPEIIRENGLLFDAQEEIPEKLDWIVENYESFFSRDDLPTIATVGEEYLAFAQRLLEQRTQERCGPDFKLLDAFKTFISIPKI